MVDLPPPEAMLHHRPLSIALHLGVSGGAGVAVGLVAGFSSPWQSVPLLSWDATALTWMAMLWLRIRRLDAVGTSVHATFEDPRRATADAMLLSSSIISLVAVVLGVIKAGSSSGAGKTTLLVAGIVTVVLSWAVVHTLYTLRYAGIYYRGPDGGIDFNQDEKPAYLDFAYLAFTIGMTYQVSDTNLTTKEIRHTALRHALLSYLFGTVIIATTINLAAGLAK